MGILTRIINRLDTRSLPVPDPGYGSLGFFGPSDSGPVVTPETSLAAPAVFACVGIISSSVATLPVAVLRTRDGGKELDHPVAALLARPNEYQVASGFRETIMLNVLLYGNSFAAIERDATGQPVALYPLKSSVSQVRRIGGELIYGTRIGSETFTFTADQIVHIAGPSLDGLMGTSPIQQGAKESIGISLALSRFQSRFYSVGCNLGGFIIAPTGMTDQAFSSFLTKWKAAYTGENSAFRIAPLPGGFDFKAKGVNPEQSQLNDSKVQTIREVAMAYRVPLHLLGLMEGGSSFSSIEQQNMSFAQNTLLAWCVRLEQELGRKLLREDEQATLRISFNLDGLMRGTTKERYEAHNLALMGGWKSRNEVRALENLPPVEGGDVLLTPLNMAPGNGQPTNPPNGPAANDPASRSIPVARLLESAARRLLTKEVRAVGRGAKKFAGKTTEFRAWLDDFYDDHRAMVESVFEDFEPIAICEDFSVEHCRQSVGEAAAAFDAGSIDQLLTRWESDRPVLIAKKMLGDAK